MKDPDAFGGLPVREAKSSFPLAASYANGKIMFFAFFAPLRWVGLSKVSFKKLN